MDYDYDKICRLSWNGTKKPTQPDYDDLIESYRAMLLSRAAKAIRENAPSDDVFRSFEQAAINWSYVQVNPNATPDQGYEQITDTETAEEAEAARVERAKKREEATPEHAKPKQGKLPADFPYHDLLAEADINTYAQARKADWTQVDGIGPARAAEIDAALNDA